MEYAFSRHTNSPTLTVLYLARPRLGSCNVAGLARFMHRLVSDEIGDIRNHPVVAGFDEPVVVESRDVIFDHAYLLGDHLQQRMQRLAAIEIAHPVDDWQEVI